MEEKFTLPEKILDAISAVRGEEYRGAADVTQDVFPLSLIIKKEQAEKEKKKLQTLKAGDKMPDGSIYLGYMRGKDWYVTAEDAQDQNGKRLRFKFNEACGYARVLHVHSHADWKLPSEELEMEGILTIMYRNASIGAFEGTYSPSDGISGFYWSSNVSSDGKAVEQINFRWGDRVKVDAMNNYGSVRCVRSVPRVPKEQE